MKILLIDKNLVVPVNYRKWQLLAQKPGVEMVAVTPDRWIENYRLVHPPKNHNFGFPVIPLKVFWPGYENRCFYLWGLGHVIRTTSPDIIISFEEPFSIFALQTWIAAKRCGSRAKIVLHTWDNLSMGVRYSYRPRIFYRMIERWMMPRVDMLIAANQEAADWRARTFATEIHKVYFGIDTKAFLRNKNEPAEKKSNADVFTVGFIGRMLVDKGVDTLIDALVLMPESVHLLLIGSGRDDEYLAKKVHALGLSNRVEFHPTVPSTDVPKYLSKMDVFVLPSRTMPLWKEQYGRALVEAMACGVPVIGSSSGAIPDVIGDAGLVFPEGNVEELTQCIEKLRKDPALRIQFGAMARTRAAIFSAERFADIVYDLVSSLMDTSTTSNKKNTSSC